MDDSDTHGRDPHLSGMGPAGDAPVDDDLSPADEFNVLGTGIVLLLLGYAAAGVLALLLGAYSALRGWTLAGGQPYWALLLWPLGAVGLLTPGLMELDEVTEVRRTPPVLWKAIVGYGLPPVGYAAGWVLGASPVGVAGLVATATFTALSLLYVWQRPAT